MKDFLRSLLAVYGIYVIGHTIKSAGTSFFPFNLYISSHFYDAMNYLFIKKQFEAGIPAGIIVATLCLFALLKLKKIDPVILLYHREGPISID